MRHASDISRLPWLTALLTLGAVVLLHPTLTSMFEYDRSLTHGMDLFRFITCQWTHWSFNHFVWDALVFVVLGAIIESRRRETLVVTIAISAVAVPVAVHLFCPTLTHFRGLSGIDTALAGCLITTSLTAAIRRRDTRTILLSGTAFLLVVTKTAIELATQRPVFAEADAFVVVPLAHAVGFACGMVAALRATLQNAESMGKVSISGVSGSLLSSCHIKRAAPRVRMSGDTPRQTRCALFRK